MDTTTLRDFEAEMNLLIDNTIPDGDYIASELAVSIVENLNRTDPDLLHGWLRDRAVVLLTGEVSTRRRHRTRLATQQASRAVFNNAAKKFEAHLQEQKTGAEPGSLGGDAAPLALFAQHLVVNGEHLARPIGLMTKEDHQYVAAQHGNRAKAAQLEQAFHEAVASLIPAGGVTRDVMNEQDFIRLRDSIRAF